MRNVANSIRSENENPIAPPPLFCKLGRLPPCNGCSIPSITYANCSFNRLLFISNKIILNPDEGYAILKTQREQPSKVVDLQLAISLPSSGK